MHEAAVKQQNGNGSRNRLLLVLLKQSKRCVQIVERKRRMVKCMMDASIAQNAMQIIIDSCSWSQIINVHVLFLYTKGLFVSARFKNKEFHVTVF